jgi:hypothetical protein
VGDSSSRFDDLGSDLVGKTRADVAHRGPELYDRLHFPPTSMECARDPVAEVAMTADKTTQVSSSRARPGGSRLCNKDIWPMIYPSR